MSFYLLKSELHRKTVGDILTDLTQIESIGLLHQKLPDDVSERPKKYRDINEFFLVKVVLKSQDHYIARFNTVESAKKVIKEMLGGKIADETLDDWVPQED